MENKNINELIKKSLQNDRNAFRQIVESYQTMIFSLTFRVLGNEEDAKDIVQDTFLKVWIHLKDFNPQQKFTTWIYKIASNLCIDKLKRKRLITTDCYETLLNVVTTENLEEKLTNQELGNIILSLTNELSPKQKIVFTLRYLEDIEVEEIKDITGLSAEKIKSNLYLAKQTIRKKLENIELCKQIKPRKL